MSHTPTIIILISIVFFCNFELFLNSPLKEFCIQEFRILGFQLLDSEFCTFFGIMNFGI